MFFLQRSELKMQIHDLFHTIVDAQIIHSFLRLLVKQLVFFQKIYKNRVANEYFNCFYVKTHF